MDARSVEVTRFHHDLLRGALVGQEAALRALVAVGMIAHHDAVRRAHRLPNAIVHANKATLHSDPIDMSHGA